MWFLFLFPSQRPNIEKLPNESLSLSSSAKDVSDNRQSSTSEGASPVSVSEAQRCMSLYFALCTKVVHYFLVLKQQNYTDMMGVLTKHIALILIYTSTRLLILNMETNQRDNH